MPKTHKLEFDGYHPLATIEIDEEKAEAAIKEMVEFWTNWQKSLQNQNGDYTKAWLILLGEFILRNGEPPKTSEEGWFPVV